MSKIVILGAGIAGHTAARHLHTLLPAEHQIVVVSPNPEWNWVPSNVWVGVGQMAEKEVTFDLAEIYKKTRIDFKQAKGIAIHPEGSSTQAKPHVTIESTLSSTAGQMESIEYDYLINATGPKLNFGATEGLGPDHGHTVSVYTAAHASEANHKLQIIIQALKRCEKKTIVIGTGHGTCTCQGAAFEYIYNVECKNYEITGQNCNLQFSLNYKKYYTLAISAFRTRLSRLPGKPSSHICQCCRQSPAWT